MVAIVILRQNENGNLYDQDGHLRNATGQKLDAQGNVILDADATEAPQPVEAAAPPKALADYNSPDEYYANRSAIRLPEIQNQNFELKPQYYTLVSQIPYFGVTARASYGPSREVRGSYRCYSYGWSPRGLPIVQALQVFSDWRSDALA